MDESIGELVKAEQDSPNQLAMLNDSEVNRSIETAKKYPRDVKAFVEEARAMATVDPEAAASMFYVLKRGDKKIEGPSTRLAEIAGSCYGNLRFGSRIIDIGETHITAQGICFDVQKNISASVDVQRRITTKEGRRFGDDMIGVTSNAACSIALRNAIFKVIPMVFINSIYKDAKAAAIGSVKSIAEQRVACLDYFRKLGVDDADILAFADVKSIQKLTEGHLVELRSVANIISTGEQTIEEALGLETPPPDIDWAWFDEKLNTVTTEKALDDFRNEMIEMHPQDKQAIWDRAEEHREQIKAG